MSAHPPRASSSPLPLVIQRGHDAGREGAPVALRVPSGARSEADAHHADPLLLALARYIQALDQRYPDGPERMRDTRLATRANMPTVLHPKGPAA
jgi:hypothetical protein